MDSPQQPTLPPLYCRQCFQSFSLLRTTVECAGCGRAVCGKCATTEDAAFGKRWFACRGPKMCAACVRERRSKQSSSGKMAEGEHDVEAEANEPRSRRASADPVESSPFEQPTMLRSHSTGSHNRNRQVGRRAMPCPPRYRYARSHVTSIRCGFSRATPVVEDNSYTDVNGSASSSSENCSEGAHLYAEPDERREIPFTVDTSDMMGLQGGASPLKAPVRGGATPAFRDLSASIREQKKLVNQLRRDVDRWHGAGGSAPH